MSDPLHRHSRKSKSKISLQMRYKTEICHNFVEEGFCKFGDVFTFSKEIFNINISSLQTCSFAHDKDELRSPV